MRTTWMTACFEAFTIDLIVKNSANCLRALSLSLKSEVFSPNKGHAVREFSSTSAVKLDVLGYAVCTTSGVLDACSTADLASEGRERERACCCARNTEVGAEKSAALLRCGGAFIMLFAPADQPGPTCAVELASASAFAAGRSPYRPPSIAASLINRVSASSSEPLYRRIY
eukprot:414510-Prorocentrum_minimum.AAC.2